MTGFWKLKSLVPKKGVSPIIGAVFMFSILFSTLALIVIWQASVEQMELQKQRQRLQMEAERGGESLQFFGYNGASNTMGLFNNGSVASTIVYMKEVGSSNGAFNSIAGVNLSPGDSTFLTISISDWDSLIVGTALGNEFVYNRPTAIIKKYEPTGADFTFYGDGTAEGSTIVNWEWDFNGSPAYGQNVQVSLPYDEDVVVTLTVTDVAGLESSTSVTINVEEPNVVGQVTPIIALENVGNTGSTYGSWWIFRFRKGCDQVTIPLQNISEEDIALTDMKVFWHELEQADPCISDLCPARLASVRIYRQYKPGGVWNGDWLLERSTEPTSWDPDFDPDPTTPQEENFPSGIALLGKYRFMDPEDLWTECFWGFYETQDCNCLDCEGTSPDYIGFNISGELFSFVAPNDPNTPEGFVFEAGETIVVTLRFCAGNRCGDDLTLKLYDPEEVYTVTVHVPLDIQVGPRDGAVEDSSSITFRWRELFDYQSWFLFGGCVHDDDYHYWLQISTDPLFPAGETIDIVGGDVFDYTEVAIAKYTQILNPHERYYWRINGSKDQGNTWSGWSRPWTFCTLDCPPEQLDSTLRDLGAGNAAMEPLLPYIMVFSVGIVWFSVKLNLKRREVR